MSERRILITVLFILMLLKCVITDNTVASKRKITPLFSRRMAEEIDDNTTILPCTIQDDSQSHLVSFFVKNVRQLFEDLDEPTTTIPDITITPDSFSLRTVFTEATTFKELRRASRITKDIGSSINITVDTTKTMSENNETLQLALSKDVTTKPMKEKNGTFETAGLSKDEIILGKIDDLDNSGNAIGQNEPPTSASTLMSNEKEAYNRSCIFCNNIDLEDCTYPANKLVPAIVCPHDDDLCYTMHTPFGVIDRGCYNVKYNLTVYVCSCNLCNYMPVDQLPYWFSRKRDWIENVIEQTHTNNFRKSVFKGMTCLHCEVNATSGDSDLQKYANCYDGNVAVLPIRQCKENEVCAIRSIKGKGYLWRGCLKTQRYNYWWTFCDADFCNYDPRVSLYDHIS